MILKDMLNRIDDNTDVAIFNNGGGRIYNYQIDERYMDAEIIFPISATGSTIEIWIDEE